MSFVLRPTFSLTVLLIAASFGDASGADLAQPKKLALAPPVTQDAQVAPVGCCEGCASCCCEPICCPKCVTEEVEKSCWLVNRQLVCIPSFRWPWECRQGDCDCGHGVGDGCACPPKCGRVRCVKVLEEHKYTCQECGYEWEVKCVCDRNGCCCTEGCCPHCGCDPSCGACASTSTQKKSPSQHQRCESMPAQGNALGNRPIRLR
jgi:hypothetical protein